MSDTKQQIEDMAMWLKLFEQEVFESLSQMDTRIKVRIYTDKFQLIPSVWRLRKPWTKEAAKHYGHTWAGTFSWLWWEVEFYGVVKS